VHEWLLEVGHSWDTKKAGCLLQGGHWCLTGASYFEKPPKGQGTSLSARPGPGISKGEGWLMPGFASSSAEGRRTQQSSRAQQCRPSASTESSASKTGHKATGVKAADSMVS